MLYKSENQYDNYKIRIMVMNRYNDLYNFNELPSLRAPVSILVVEYCFDCKNGRRSLGLESMLFLLPLVFVLRTEEIAEDIFKIALKK